MNPDLQTTSSVVLFDLHQNLLEKRY